MLSAASARGCRKQFLLWLTLPTILENRLGERRADLALIGGAPRRRFARPDHGQRSNRRKSGFQQRSVHRLTRGACGLPATNLRTGSSCSAADPGLASCVRPGKEFFGITARCPGTTVEEAVTERPGTVIGPHKLLEQIGEG